MKITGFGLFVLMFAGLSGFVHAAPLVDFTIKASLWQTDYSGEVGTDGQIATVSELGFADEDQNVITVELRHALPILPNIRVQDTDLQADASGTLTRALEFNEVIFTADIDVETDLDLSHTDVTLFYSPVDNWITLDVGLTARYFRSSAMVSSSSLEADEELNEWVPMAYLGFGFELPVTGFYIDSSINAISYQDSEIIDASLLLGYQYSLTTGVDLLAEIGYRDFSVDIDDDFDGDLQVDGVQFSIGLVF